MAGESYGVGALINTIFFDTEIIVMSQGRYIPVFASYVYDQNPKLVESGVTPINLTSIMIGRCEPRILKRISSHLLYR